jgi:hypothetical protein
MWTNRELSLSYIVSYTRSSSIFSRSIVEHQPGNIWARFFLAQRIEEMADEADKLEQAFANIDVETVQELLKRASDPKEFISSYKVHFGMTALHDAITKFIGRHLKRERPDEEVDKMLAILKELVQSGGADVNEPNFGHPPIWRALMGRHLPIVKYLIEAGADVNFAVRRPVRPDLTTLAKATYAGPEFVSYLFQHNARLLDQDHQVLEQSALFRACENIVTLDTFIEWYKLNAIPFPWLAAMRKMLTLPQEAPSIAVYLRASHQMNKSQTFHYFLLAARRARTYLMRTMIEKTPELLQSDWLVKNEIPRYLANNTHCTSFLAWLKDIRTQPLALKFICKLEIVRALGPTPESHMESLPLPNQLKKYLTSGVYFTRDEEQPPPVSCGTM